MADDIQSLRRPPGKGGRGRHRPRGRHADAEALEAVRAILGTGPYARDMLIEYLHRLQDATGYLAAGRLVALAEVMRLPLAEVYEVASFYHNFEIVEDGAAPPPPITVNVCESLPCQMAGADALAEALAADPAARVRVKRAACLGRCDRAPACRVGPVAFEAATPAAILEAVDDGPPLAQPFWGFEPFRVYREKGGYRLLAACHAGELTPEGVIETLEHASLRGLGGAGFPTGRKWRFVRAEPGPRLMAINGDESEPGTFKDRHFLLTEPHRMLEGALIGAWAVEATDLYIYIRDEYADIRAILANEVPKLNMLGLELPTIHLRRGAGAYICGEESAMLESLEGKRGLPRHKPPFPAQVGLFGRPTLINNVETLHWIPAILEQGPEWFASQGKGEHKGLRAFSVSGRVRSPGVKIAPAGISARQLIEEHCDGMAQGHSLLAYLPGGASGGILPASLADLPLDFGSLEKYGCLVGSHALIVLSEQDSPAAAALNLMAFFESESCGQCTPCRVGCEKARMLMSAETWDEVLLGELAGVMADASICGLGQAAPNGLKSVFRFFPEDVRKA